MYRKKLESLIRSVLVQNIRLRDEGLVMLTWGNVSEIDRASGIVAIKPSGVNYSEMTNESIVLCDLEGNPVESRLRPSSDLPTHLALYREFDSIGGVVHTHSTCATAFAQACVEIPCFGTTHADYFHGAVPVSDSMLPAEIETDYEHNTGLKIIQKLASMNQRPAGTKAMLVANHGPFCWGDSARDAVETALVLEEIARMALHTLALAPEREPISPALLDKHFLRKHGKNSYYGQGVK